MYRLLIVDPDRDTCETLKYLIDWSEFSVTSILTAKSYADCFSLAVDFRPHIALIGMDLGQHRGYEVAEHFRSMGMDTACCIMSSRTDFSEVQQSINASARGFLMKPIDVTALRRMMERVVVWELHGQLPERTAVPEKDPVLGVDYARFSNITNKIILVVKSNYRSSQSLTGIAEALNMSSKYIGRVFLRDTGLRFSDYLTAYRMIQARRLIESTQEKISVIASMVGYSQLNNFYVHFKRYYGQSPSALRDYAPREAANSNEISEA